ILSLHSGGVEEDFTGRPRYRSREESDAETDGRDVPGDDRAARAGRRRPGPRHRLQRPTIGCRSAPTALTFRSPVSTASGPVRGAAGGAGCSATPSLSSDTWSSARSSPSGFSSSADCANVMSERAWSWTRQDVHSARLLSTVLRGRPATWRIAGKPPDRLPSA